jgi:hypothetical protein
MATDRLSEFGKDKYVAEMQALSRRILEKVADAVNHAPTGNVISGSEMEVRDLFEELRRLGFEKAVQMRADSHESASPPSKGRGGPAQGRQRP